MYLGLVRTHRTGDRTLRCTAGRGGRALNVRSGSWLPDLVISTPQGPGWTSSQARVAHTRQREEAVMNRPTDDPSAVVDQLATRYPQRSRGEIQSVVERHWHSFDTATVRAFVPVLVTRQAATELRHH
jgi:hypothetical protein